jgi:hypothetical protein
VNPDDAAFTTAERRAKMWSIERFTSWSNCNGSLRRNVNGEIIKIWGHLWVSLNGIWNHTEKM